MPLQASGSAGIVETEVASTQTISSMIKELLLASLMCVISMDYKSKGGLTVL